MTLLIVGAGGALGAVSRYVVTGWVQGLTAESFPWGTLLVNVGGSLALGFTLVWIQSTVSSTDLRQFITIGFLVSFTTFSTFSYEVVALLRDREWWQAGGYVTGSVAFSLVAVVIGMAMASALAQART
jgi:CrcB protein